MKELTVIFYISMAIWFLSELYYKKVFTSTQNAKKKDKSTLNVLWIVIIPSISLAIFISDVSRFPISKGEWIYFLGESCIAIGILFRWIIIRSLGKYFTVDVSIREDHQIKKEGFYKYMRHPSYTFALLTFVGLGLFLNNWVSFAVAFIPPFLAFNYRIKVEEQALIEQFGDEYIQYKKQTRRLIPFIY
ncbi:isoprenylcysteine carboxylmethyltransferase family protein [Chryseobacterium sp. Y16C]|uniref:methyltransferase family protein n=1 Tax=Chryseobacterium sp. Y16C TaxID=2920939 RepID=UPI001F0AEFD9|nr:isoprenylcysteine carboxylmethyltransferase family protein [Chryseobacterium sp. Y16C]UMQ40630.1 isoprenylcysteine carboxylmethyltransferase family protein [Chryseobacterium sp. Y16C]